MTLTHDDLKKLQAFFPAKDHSFVKGSQDKMYAYLEEDPIMSRVESVDPAAGWSIEGVSVRKDGDTHSVSVWGTLTIKGVSRSGMGSAAVTLYSFTKKKTGENVTGEANEAEKSAATDALKRAARMFGIGRYLLSLPDSINNTGSLEKWLDAQNRVQVSTQTDATDEKPTAWQPSQAEWENKVLPYLDETFGLNQEHALRALECMQQSPLPFLRIQDWLGTRDNALSVWLAYSYKFDETAIRADAAKLGLSETVTNKAVEYIERLQPYYNQTYAATPESATPEQAGFNVPLATDIVTYHGQFTELHTTPRIRVYGRDAFRTHGIDCEGWVKGKTYTLGQTIIVPDGTTKVTEVGNVTTNKIEVGELQF